MPSSIVFLVRKMQTVVDISPKSRKAKSRIGHIRPAVVEQKHHDKMFVNFVGLNYSCWMPLDGGADWVVFNGED